MSWAIDENEFVYVSPTEQANGNWVKWEDYARLKAEVERLTKAGDAMMGWIDRQHDDSGYPHSEAWEAATEGKQSK